MSTWLAADTATFAAPWWGVPTIAGSFLVIGGGLSFLSTYASDRRRANHDRERAHQDEAARHRRELLAAAAAFLVETKEVFESYKRNFVVDRAGAVQPVDGPSYNLSRADQAYWSLVFLAPEHVESVARDLHEITALFYRFKRGSHDLLPFNSDGWRRARNAYFASRKALVAAVKEDDTQLWT